MKRPHFYLQVQAGVGDRVLGALPRITVVARGHGAESDPAAEWISIRGERGMDVASIRTSLREANLSDHVVRIDALPKAGDGLVYARQRAFCFEPRTDDSDADCDRVRP